MHSYPSRTFMSAVIAGLLAAACSSDRSDGPAPATGPVIDDTYAFHVYVGTSGSPRKRLDIPPTAAVSAPESGASQSAVGPNGVRTQSVSPAADRSIALGSVGQPGGDESW